TSTNEYMKNRLYNKVSEYFNGDLKGKKIAVWGLSFKPNTNDVRESAALVMIRDLVGDGALVSAYDPMAAKSFENEFGKHYSVEYAPDKYHAARNADAIVIVTEWDTFKSVDFEKLGGIMRNRTIFDGRSIYTPHSLAGTGFYYDSVG